MQQAITHVLYLHGFRSSPQSNKARTLAQAVAACRPAPHWWCPLLPPSPQQALREVMAGVADWPHARMAVVGSSLGGCYATWVAEQTGCRCVLLNPAVVPARDLAAHLGEHPYWHDPSQSFTFTAQHVAELQGLQTRAITRPERYLAFIATGDEVLDWREMHALYAQARVRVIEGSDHALSDFGDYLAEIFGFLGLGLMPSPSLPAGPAPKE